MQAAVPAYRGAGPAGGRRLALWARRVWRNGPEAILVRGSVVLLAGAIAARLHAAHDPGVLCPLRLVTGIPCPFCGSTTSFMELGSGDAAAAVAAQPVTMLAAGVLVTKPAGWYRRWEWTPRRTKVALLLSAVAVSWVYQLIRFDVIG